MAFVSSVFFSFYFLFFVVNVKLSRNLLFASDKIAISNIFSPRSVPCDAFFSLRSSHSLRLTLHFEGKIVFAFNDRVPFFMNGPARPRQICISAKWSLQCNVLFCLFAAHWFAGTFFSYSRFLLIFDFYLICFFLLFLSCRPVSFPHFSAFLFPRYLFL